MTAEGGERQDELCQEEHLRGLSEKPFIKKVDGGGIRDP